MNKKLNEKVSEGQNEEACQIFETDLKKREKTVQKSLEINLEVHS